MGAEHKRDIDWILLGFLGSPFSEMAFSLFSPRARLKINVSIPLGEPVADGYGRLLDPLV